MQHKNPVFRISSDGGQIGPFWWINSDTHGQWRSFQVRWDSWESWRIGHWGQCGWGPRLRPDCECAAIEPTLGRVRVHGDMLIEAYDTKDRLAQAFDLFDLIEAGLCADSEYPPLAKARGSAAVE